MHPMTAWVYVVLGYNVCWILLLYTIPSVRWNTKEGNIRSISGILSIFHAAGIIGFGGLYATLFLVFSVASVKQPRLFVLAVVMMLCSMGVLGFDVHEYHGLHTACFVSLQLSLLLYANLLPMESGLVCTRVVNALTALLLLSMICTAFGMPTRSLQNVIEIFWALSFAWYVVIVTKHIENAFI